MARHTEFTVRIGLPIYFCDPHSPWQHGTNKNTNGLLRQYFPKGADPAVALSGIIDRVAMEPNGRPRETLNWLIVNHCAAMTD